MHRHEAGHGERTADNLSGGDRCRNGTEEEALDPLFVAAVRQLCAWDGEDAAVGHALAAGMDVSAGDNYAIRHAASHGHAHVVKLLCGLPRCRGIDVSVRNYEVLRQAARHGHASVLELLCDDLCRLPLGLGVDSSVLFQVPLMAAAQLGHTECVRVLCNLPLERGVNPAARRNLALRLARTTDM